MKRFILTMLTLTLFNEIHNGEASAQNIRFETSPILSRSGQQELQHDGTCVVTW